MNIYKTIFFMFILLLPKISASMVPTNDNFSDAIEIFNSSGSVEGNNLNATKETGEPVLLSGDSVWYKWTATQTDKFLFTITGSDDPNAVTVVPVAKIFIGTAVDSLQSVSNLGSDTRPSVLDATKGQTYFILIDTDTCFLSLCGAGRFKFFYRKSIISPSLVKDINPGQDGSSPGLFKKIGDIAVFLAKDEIHGTELWRTDGSPTGTQLIKDVTPGDEDTNFRFLGTVGDVLYYYKFIEGGLEIWKTDGTSAGTVISTDKIIPTVENNNTQFLYFSSRQFPYGLELWRTDGTTEGTTIVKDINPGSSSGLDIFHNSRVSINGVTYFMADDGPHGVELWRTNGFESGTYMVKEINPPNIYDDNDAFYSNDKLLVLNDELYFPAKDDIVGRGLWRSDGTEEGTIRIKHLPGIDQLTVVNNELFFMAADGAGADGLWKSDGTEQGTTLIKGNFHGSFGGEASDLTAVGELLYFSANHMSDQLGKELWVSDGTEQGTKLVKDLNTVLFSGGSELSNLTDVNGTLFFEACYTFTNTGCELWKSNGSQENTILVEDLRPGPLSGRAFGLFNLDGKLLFTANEGSLGFELYASNYFLDVPPNHWSYIYVSELKNKTITGGCGSSNYCPEAVVSRAQMAVFLEKALNGSDYTPPAVTGMFGDVPASNPFAPWIEQLARDGITGGCGNSNYCPNAPISRAQMAVFLLKSTKGSDYIPPPALGTFNDVPITSGFAPWIEQLAEEGITGGCGNNNYCPSAPVSRDQMAVFLVKAFEL